MRCSPCEATWRISAEAYGKRAEEKEREAREHERNVEMIYGAETGGWTDESIGQRACPIMMTDASAT